MSFSYIYNNLFVEKLIRCIPDKIYVSLLHKKNIGVWPNLHNPLTFSEKIQWLKLYDRKPLYTMLVDKYAVKEYVKEKVGAEYVIPTLATFKHVNDLTFRDLPNQFVLKWNHNSGCVVICRDSSKIDLEITKSRLRLGERKNGFWYGREWPYKNVKPLIVAEKFISTDNYNSPDDFKFFCFNGSVEFFKIDFNRFTNHRANYYGKNCNLLPFGETVCPPDFQHKIVFPRNISDMFRIAEELSKNIPFVRIDLYNVNGKIYFGEMTFFPASGFGNFIPQEWNRKLGKLISI